MAVTAGITGSRFGVPTWTGFVVDNYSVGQTFGLSVTIANETGSIVGRRWDDVIKNLKVEAIHVSGAVPAMGDVFTYDSGSYNIEQIDDAGSAGAWRKYTISAIKSQYC